MLVEFSVYTFNIPLFYNLTYSLRHNRVFKILTLKVDKKYFGARTKYAGNGHGRDPF